MKRIKQIIAIAVVILLVVLVYLGGFHYWSYDGNPNVKLNLILDKNGYKKCENITISCSLINNDFRRYSLYTHVNNVWLVIKDTNNTKVFTHIHMELQSPSEHYINLDGNSEQIIHKFIWDQTTLFFSNGSILNGSYKPVETGNYLIYSEVINYPELNDMIEVSIKS